MMRLFLTALMICVCGSLPTVRADVESGPAAGSTVKELKVYAVTGEAAGKEINATEARGEKPTLFLFIPADKWGRPTARLMRELDGKVKETAEGGAVVAVWLTSDVDATKEYLPKAQQSLKLENTALTVDATNPTGPGDWGINTDADVTVVVTLGGKVTKSFGYSSPNETLAKEVLATLKGEEKKE
ncbi:MAG: hypothetical protein R3C01_17455 [Planctomycetaceae bacterium]